MLSRGRHYLPGAVALAVVSVLAVMMTFPRTSEADRDRLAAHYAFTRQAISTEQWSGTPVRRVEPALQGIRSWISAVGAGVALSDVDGDGLSNDVCLVDPRFDTVSLAPAPGTGDRYPRRTLVPTGIPFDARTTAPTGCVPGDFNEDGYTDLLVHYWGRSPVLFLRRAGVPLRDPGAFVARDLVPPQVWNTDAVSLADVDGDGHVDIIVGNYFPDGARLLDPTVRHDPALQMPASMSLSPNGGADRILLWSSGTSGFAPTAHFREARGVLPDHVARGWTLAIGAPDLNRDGLPELYIAHDFGPDSLLVNHSRPGHPAFSLVQGTRYFTTPKSKVIGKDSFKSMGVSFPDLNQDGLPDIVVSNITSNYAFHESNEVWLSTGQLKELDRGGAPYKDHSEALGLSRSGWAWDVKAADFDNDGRDEIVQAVGFLRGSANRWAQLQQFAASNDLVLSHPRLWPLFQQGTDLSGHERNPFFARASDGGRFVDVGGEVGVGQPGVSRSIAVADVDGDGRLDFAVANQWAPSYLMRNAARSANGYLGLRLRVPATTGSGTMAAVGASVRLTRADGRVLTDQVYPANGHAGVSAPELLFGLGPKAGPARVDVRWRDGRGAMHATTLTLRPGWHTLLLTPAGGVEEQPR
jgi:hypothetical protein